MEAKSAPSSARYRRLLSSSPFRSALAYVVFAGLWIILSDRALLALTSEPNILSLLQTAKGWLFIVASGVLIGVLRVREQTTRDRSEMIRREADAGALGNYRDLLERLVTLEQSIGVADDLTRVHGALRRFVETSVPCNGLFISRYEPADDQRHCVYTYVEGEEEDVSLLPPMPMKDSAHAWPVAAVSSARCAARPRCGRQAPPRCPAARSPASACRAARCPRPVGP
jgi:hypothetical protein